MTKVQNLSDKSKSQNSSQSTVIHIKAETTFQDVKKLADEYREQTRQRVLKKFHEAGVTELPLCDLCFGVRLYGYQNPYDEIKNIVAQLTNSMSDGYFFYLETVRLRRELDRLKARPIEDVRYKVRASTITRKESEVCDA